MYRTMRLVVMLTVLSGAVSLPIVAEPSGTAWKSGATTVTLNNGTLTVSGKGAMANYNAIEGQPSAPWWDNSISKTVTSVVIEDGVTHIGNGAFAGCTLMTSVTIGNKVKTIGKHAFITCFALTSFTIPQGVVSLGGGAFNSCMGLTSVIIPNTVTTIEYRAFSGCVNLTSMTIPNSVKTIGSDIFCNCTSLTSINVVADNNNYASEDGVLFNKNKTVLITYPRGRHGTYIIPQGVTKIGDYAFGRCIGLTSITIPGSVKTIGEGVFENISISQRLTSIVSLNPIPPGITRYTFNGLSSNVCLYVPANSIDTYRGAWKELEKLYVANEFWKEFKCIKDLASAPKEE